MAPPLRQSDLTDKGPIRAPAILNQRPDTVAPSSGLPARLPTLDGLRGIAILLVMLFHYEVRNWPWHSDFAYPLWAVMREGWLGVDLFFVLSGFLITGILVDTKENPGYFRNFYARRTLRIFPLYFAYLALLFLILPLLPRIAPWQAETPFATQIWFWSYLCNLLIGVQGWGASPKLAYHTWSLAVEEQFYLIWPAVVLLSSRRSLVRICVACIIGAVVFRTGLRLAHLPWVAGFVLTPARVDGLAMGALVALAVRSSGGLARVARFARPAALAAAIAFIGLFAWRGLVDAEDKVMGTLGLSVCALLFAAVVCVAVTERTGSLVYRALTPRVLLLVGRYSYGMYLIHYVVLMVLNEIGLSLQDMEARLGWRPAAHAVYILCNCLATFGLAALSWHLFEKRFLRLKDRFRYGTKDEPALVTAREI